MECKLETIQTAYASMLQNGWDTSLPLNWGFFFQSKAKDNLDEIFRELKKYDYHLIGLEEVDGGGLMMQVQKREALSAEKLHRRNISFNDLAENNHSIYDGWDVSKV